MKYYEKKLFCIYSYNNGFFVACESNNESTIHDDTQIARELFEQNEHNLDLRNFALAVSNAMSQSKDFKKLIQVEAMKKFDGEYNVLLSSIMNKQVHIDNTVSPLRSAEEYSVADLLGNYYISTDQSGLRASTTPASIIADLSAKYPDLQVSIPVNADKLDETKIPIVTFIPDVYEDGVTRFVTGYKPDGSIYMIDALNEPEEAIIVVSHNERRQLQRIRKLSMEYYEEDNEEIPPKPLNLTGTQTQSGILLSWTMESAGTVTGYKIYRKGPYDTQFILIYTQNGRHNNVFYDVNPENGGTFSYYITAYNHSGESYPSNTISVVAFPRPVTPSSFEAILNTNKEVELRWATDPNAYIEKVELHRYILNQTSNYNLYQTFSSSKYDYFDRNITQGTTIRYKLQTVNIAGVSSPRYDIVKIPYRDPSKISPIKIKHINCSKNVEGWLMGTPELRITICGVDKDNKTTEIKSILIDMDKYDQNFDKWVLDWKPDSWYHTYTFHVVEEDPGCDIKINISAKLGIKKTFSWGADLGFDVGVGKEFKFSAPEIIGPADLHYYDPINSALKFNNGKYWCDIIIGQ